MNQCDVLKLVLWLKRCSAGNTVFVAHVFAAKCGLKLEKCLLGPKKEIWQIRWHLM